MLHVVRWAAPLPWTTSPALNSGQLQVVSYKFGSFSGSNSIWQDLSFPFSFLCVWPLSGYLPLRWCGWSGVGGGAGLEEERGEGGGRLGVRARIVGDPTFRAFVSFSSRKFRPFFSFWWSSRRILAAVQGHGLPKERFWVSPRSFCQTLAAFRAAGVFSWSRPKYVTTKVGQAKARGETPTPSQSSGFNVFGLPKGPRLRIGGNFGCQCGAEP